MDYFYLSKTVLFSGMKPNEIEHMLGCLAAKEKSYQKDEIIYYTGDVVTALGIVLSGSVLIENDDIWGNRSVLDQVGPGQIFAETYACIPGEKLLVNVTAAENSKVLFLDVGRMVKICSQACEYHNRLIRNLLTVASQKNMNLSRRIFNTSSKSIRGRLLSYLSYQAVKEGRQEFDIPFNRQQLADYLSVDRSAMSSELSKMQKDGLIRFKRNHFYIHVTEEM